MKERKLDYLHRNKIIYRRDPVNDQPTEVYDWGEYYEDGTFECYTLFNTTALIRSYKSFKWHLRVLWYLNPQMNKEEFAELVRYIGNPRNGFVIYGFFPGMLEDIVEEVALEDLEEPPSNKIRKIIFRDHCGLTTSEKLKIVGQLIGKHRISESEIYEAMLLIHGDKEKITIEKLAYELGCSKRTVYRNMSEELKKEKIELNEELWK